MGNLRPDGIRSAASSAESQQQSQVLNEGQQQTRQTRSDQVTKQTNAAATTTTDEAGPSVSPPQSSDGVGSRTIRIRFLDQLSPEAQQAYHDEQERKKEEKKSKIEELAEVETRIERVEQPSAAMLASQTLENTQYNRQHAAPAAAETPEPSGPAPPPPVTSSDTVLPSSSTRVSESGGSNEHLQTNYSQQQQLIIQQQSVYESQVVTNGGGYQNPVFDLEQQQEQEAGTWARSRDRRHNKRWTFRRTNSGRFDQSRVCPIPSPQRTGMPAPQSSTAQYEYIQLHQEQKINWTRSFTIEQQLRYGITPTGEPLDLAMLKEIQQMQQNMQIGSSQVAQCSIDNISIQNLTIQDQQQLAAQLNGYGVVTSIGGYAGLAQGQQTLVTSTANGSATLVNGGAAVASVGPGLQNNLGTQDENSNHDYSSVPMAGLPMIGALMGMCIGGPIGMLAGVKIGGFSAVMGSILGYTGASVVKEHQDFREYIDNHYEQEPQLYVQSPRDDSLNKQRERKVSRSLPEIPGQRPISSAKYMVGPNGYRRPSLVRASSFSEQRNVNIRMNVSRAGSVERSYSGARPEYSKLEGQRKLPTRPFTRMGSFEHRESQRRHPLLRNNSNLHRKMAYHRQNSGGQSSSDSFHYNNGNIPHVATSHHRNFRRYGPATDRQSLMALIAREREAREASESYLASEARTEGKLGCDRRPGWSGDKYSQHQSDRYILSQPDSRYNPRSQSSQNMY